MVYPYNNNSQLFSTSSFTLFKSGCKNNPSSVSSIHILTIVHNISIKPLMRYFGFSLYSVDHINFVAASINSSCCAFINSVKDTMVNKLYSSLLIWGTNSEYISQGNKYHKISL